MHVKSLLLAGALLASTTPAFASPFLVAATAAQLQDQTQGQSQYTGVDSTNVGVNEGVNSSSNANANDSSASGSVSNKQGDTRALGIGLSQAPTALSVEGICGKGTKIAFGALEWSDYSSKCMNYHIALIAAQAAALADDTTRANQLWTLTNQWVERADGM